MIPQKPGQWLNLYVAAEVLWQSHKTSAATYITKEMSPKPVRLVRLKRTGFGLYLLLNAKIPGLLEISARVALKGHQRIGFGDGGQLHHTSGNDFGQVFI